MSYIPHTEKEKQQMLKAIGVSSLDELFEDIDEQLRPKSFNLPEAKSEFEVSQHFKKLALKNATNLINFVGCGFYDHYIPASIDALAGRSEFLTAYTPYQPECSQGILQAIYEYQTTISMLTQMDVANASLYDGGSALFEAAMMALRITDRNKIIIDGGINPIYRTMLRTYTSNLPIEFLQIPVSSRQSSREEIYKYLDHKTAAVILQNPNFFGVIDDHSDIISRVHKFGALAIESVYPVSLGILKSPGEMDADIVVGEGQSLGIPLSFGGPYLGFMATKREYIRNLPGRIAGLTCDREGRAGFVLTLQVREQHIRREKAKSNICTNEALCALRAVIFLSLFGKEGLRQLAGLNYRKSEFAKSELEKISHIEVRRTQPTFNEFTIKLSRDADEVAEKMAERGFLCGFPLGRFYKEMKNHLLVCVTEKRTKEEILGLVRAMKEIT